MELAVPSAIMFDANAYRRLCRLVSPQDAITKARRLAAAERTAGVVVVGAQAVLVELANHLAHPEDAQLQACLSSLCMMAVHCNHAVDGRGHLRLVPMASDLLSKALYGERSPEALEFATVLDKLAANVLAYPSEDGLVRIRPHLQALAVYAANVEQSYVNLLKRFLDRQRTAPVGPPAVERLLLTSPYARDDAARYMVMLGRSALGLGGEETSMDERASIVRGKYAPAVEFAIQRLVRLMDGASPDSDRNSAWDWELSFLVGRFIAGADGAPPVPILVVTDDKAIHKAAAAAGVPDRVVALRGYMRLIGLVPA